MIIIIKKGGRFYRLHFVYFNRLKIFDMLIYQINISKINI